jgi:L-ascorbate metabolism protein UlaG (beta-lactamase superfamily)
MTEVTLTHIGGPTVLLEVEGWRLLTDPTFDAPGRRYTFGWGSASHMGIGHAGGGKYACQALRWTAGVHKARD